MHRWSPRRLGPVKTETFADFSSTKSLPPSLGVLILLAGCGDSMAGVAGSSESFQGTLIRLFLLFKHYYEGPA